MSLTINRRQFTLAASSSLALSACDSVAIGKTTTKWKLRYILGSCMYGTLPLAEILPEVDKTGAQHIDIWPRVHGNQREQIEKLGHDATAKLLEQHRVKIDLLTHYDLGPYRLQSEFQVARKFGARMIITGAGKGTGKTLRERVKSFVRSMAEPLAVAREHGVTIGIENHGNSLIESPDSMRYLAEFSPGKHLGVALAPYHLPQDEKLLSQLIEDLGPRLVHFYAWQHGMGCHKKLPKQQELLQMPGRGKLDFTPLLTAMKKIDYHGWTEIFMHPVPRGIPILETSSQVTAEINRARRYLEKCAEMV